MSFRCCVVLFASMVLIHSASLFSQEKDSGITVDKEGRIIKIDAKIAPRKLPNLQEVYPIEVIACWPHPKGKKAHETVITIEAKPSEVHKALESLGLKAGAPVMGEGEPKGPEVVMYLEASGPDGRPKRIPLDKALVDKRTKKAFPKTVKWRFTGSVTVQPDPTKDEKAYGADVSGTLISIFPVTDQTVFQTNLTVQYERFMKLETNAEVLPPEGTPVKLVIEAGEAK